MKRYALPLATLTAIGLMPNLAFAHSTSAGGLGSGLLHPLTGLDHLLAMLAIGVWAASQSGRMRFAIPGAFMLSLILGFTLALSGFVLPHVESGIALSVLLLGMLIITAARLPRALALVLSAGFALFHGFAHGQEASGSLLAFAIGFMATSGLLHLCGALTAHQVRALPMLSRAFGAVIAAGGLWMLG
ncbi:MAG: HupE/UreJ family protein [Oceanospirillales bacterium]|nr:HupE/UreJ family protein [Oceanospirillales bacterium]